MRLIDANAFAEWVHKNVPAVTPQELVTKSFVIAALSTESITPTVQKAVTGETSDGYHTFNELYHHRAVLFSVIVANYPDKAWKSKKHHDGTMFNGMFIVGIDTPDGQATYHYDVDPYWDMFKCRELDNAPEWDGHTPAQAIERIGKLKGQEPKVMTPEEVRSLPEGSVVWFEERDNGGRTYIQPMMSNGKAFMIGTHLDINVSRGALNWEGRRFWTSRPADEQRKAAPWIKLID